MAMSVSAPIPIPLTQMDEDEQLQFAVMRSLEENYSSQSGEGNDGSRYRASETDNDSSRYRASETRSRPTNIPYRRSRTVPDVVSSVSRSPSTPTLTLNPVRARSVDWSPPRPTYSTNCCEVKSAILMENQEYLKNLAKSAANVTSPLHVAVKKDHNDCIDEIIRGLPHLLSARDTQGETALFIAVTKDNLYAARKLIECGSDVNVAKSGKETPLQAAIEGGHRRMVNMLLRFGADPNKALNRGWTAIHECVYRGTSEILNLLLGRGGDPNIRDDFGISPVFTSAACGRNECLDILLRAGGDPNLCASSKAASPLYEACKESNADCAMTLLQYGADPHLANCEGLLPLHIACYKGSIELVEELLKVTSKSIAEKCGISPVHEAAKEDELEILELLIEHGYDVNIKLSKDKITYRDRRQTALFFAVYNDSEEATEILLDAGAKTELDYVKPLLVAVSHGQYTIVDLLISHGADVNTCFAEEGALFPATIAFAMKDPRMLKKILLAGCDACRCFACAIGDDDHAVYGESIQKSSFCHFISQERNRSWAGWIVSRLLGFVPNIKLCSRMRQLLRCTEEWPTIRAYTDEPRALSQWCRLMLRRSVSHREESIEQLPLPVPLISFLNYRDF